MRRICSPHELITIIIVENHMTKNKNRFEEEDDDSIVVDDTDGNPFDNDDDLSTILASCDDNTQLSTREAPPSKAEEEYAEVRSHYPDDHGLAYAVVYAHLFLLSEADAVIEIESDWRLAISSLLTMPGIVRFFRTRRDAPNFVRARIRLVLDSIGWDESASKQADEVENSYIPLDINVRMFMIVLAKRNLLSRFVDHCKINYENLIVATKELDRETIARGLKADIFTGAVEMEHVTPVFGIGNDSNTVQWVSSDIQECAKGKDNSRFLDRLYCNRFKERLEVDEAIFADLEDRFPHFAEVISFYKAQFRLNLLTGRDYIPPVLLLGAPGIGKTVFAKELAQALQTGYTFIDMASASASWTLSGLSSSWNGAKPGKLVTTMLDSPTASPVVVLDEVEKSGSSAHGQDSRTPLYQLLEENTARAFTDEFVDYPVDLSRIIYIACANSTEGLTEPLLTRFKVMEIRDPSDLEHDMIVDSIYQAQLAGSTAFPAHLPSEIKVLLRGISLREAKVAISDAIANALLEMTLKQVKDSRTLSVKLHPHHFKKKTVQKKKIGF